MPYIYWDMLLKGREWAAAPQQLEFEPTARDAVAACQWEAPGPDGNVAVQR